MNLKYFHYLNSTLNDKRFHCATTLKAKHTPTQWPNQWMRKSGRWECVCERERERERGGDRVKRLLAMLIKFSHVACQTTVTNTRTERTKTLTLWHLQLLLQLQLQLHLPPSTPLHCLPALLVSTPRCGCNSFEKFHPPVAAKHWRSSCLFLRVSSHNVFMMTHGTQALASAASCCSYPPFPTPLPSPLQLLSTV